MPDPTVSVILPVYNCRRYLVEAVGSILAQTFTDWELIAVNDGSTDGSEELLRRFQSDPRVRRLDRPHSGIVGTLNDGISQARGQFIARMDADDRSHPDRLRRQLEFMRQHPECVALGCRCMAIDPDGDPIATIRCPLEHEKIEAEFLRGFGHAMVHPAVMFRREALNDIGGYRPEYQFVEDVDLFLRLAQHGRLANLEETLLDYRVHPTSTNVLKSEQQGRLMRQSLAEARQARGLSPVSPDSQVAPNANGGASLHHRWAHWAWADGNRHAARKHAWIDLRKRPFCVESWRAARLMLVPRIGLTDFIHRLTGKNRP
jgi:glycosyltransferase involved in cell wall biosynthesis